MKKLFYSIILSALVVTGCGSPVAGKTFVVKGNNDMEGKFVFSKNGTYTLTVDNETIKGTYAYNREMDAVSLSEDGEEGLQYLPMDYFRGKMEFGQAMKESANLQN